LLWKHSPKCLLPVGLRIYIISLLFVFNFYLVIYQLSIQTKLYSELSGHTEATLHDVASALMELGIDFRSLFKYIISCNLNKIRRVAQPAVTAIPQPPPILHTSKARPHLNYIHEHFPLFPDPHTYIVTESGISNEKEYQKTREIIAQQKLNIEKALVKFKLKNELNKYPGKELSIFHEDTKDTVFMLIKNEMKSLKIPSYFNGLLHYEEIELLTSYIESTGDPKRIDQPVNKDDIVIDDIIAENLMNLT